MCHLKRRIFEPKLQEHFVSVRIHKPMWQCCSSIHWKCSSLACVWFFCRSVMKFLAIFHHFFLKKQHKFAKKFKGIPCSTLLNWNPKYLSQYIREAYGYIERKGHPPDCRKTRGNCIETIDYSISIYILMLHLYIKAFTSSWYVSNTYHSPVNVHVNVTYCIRRTLMYWSRLGRN